MKPFIITLWLVCGLTVSLAEPPRWQGPGDLISWLQSKQELNVTEYNDASLAWYKIHGGLSADKDLLGIRLIDDLAFRGFSKLREDRDLAGCVEFFEAEYDTSLKNRMFIALSDGKDDEFSARIVHHSLGRKNWYHPKASIENFELRRKLFNKLMGGEETLERIGSDITMENQQAMKRALEKKWPVLQKEPEAVREKKPPVQNVREDTLTESQPDKERSGHPGATDENRATPWMLGILVLLAATVAVVFIYIKNSRGVRR